MFMLNKARFRVSDIRDPRARTARRARWLALLVLIALVGAACGDDDSNASFDQVDSAISGGAGTDRPSDHGDSVSSDDPVSEPDDIGERLSVNEPADLTFDDDGEFGADADQVDPTESEAPQVEFPTPDEQNALGAALFVGLQIIFTGEVVLESPGVKATTDTVINAVFANGGAI
jgi:hypothetical protein